ncbi:uncharacterized protein CDV56_107298 [Aspergillus thermomutatus]|uniref:Uncharacterized protein n=1 Tax=Aspergillus thermomutatus TaxID=41047 RepID=A0A397H9R2_ASPTH|nr:uncharacterized protein CDV56_107298 [Aspergillus thermomutatus]RHZ59811.1 hypothetical protein CDV56_107298 [Aspergillus thermomutatus]
MESLLKGRMRQHTNLHNAHETWDDSIPDETSVGPATEHSSSPDDQSRQCAEPPPAIRKPANMPLPGRIPGDTKDFEDSRRENKSEGKAVQIAHHPADDNDKIEWIATMRISNTSRLPNSVETKYH